MSKLGGKKMSEDTDRNTAVNSVVAGDRISVDNTDPNNPIVTADVQAGGQVDSVVAGTNCSVDATDPVNPIVNADTQNNAKVTTKGDLEGFNTVAARIPVGTNGQVLEADSGEALGVKWATPSAGGDVATDAIFDAKGDVVGGTGSDTAARLAVGTNGQLLSADSAEATGLKWIAAPSGDPLTTKGDIMAYDTDANRLAVGTNDQVLTADSTAAEGVAWKDASGGGSSTLITAPGALLVRTTTLAGDGDVDLTFPTEIYDDNNFGAGGTANRLTVPTGMTRANVSANFQGTGGTANSLLQINIQRFTSGDAFIETVCQMKIETTDTAPAQSCSFHGAQCVAGDYFKVRVFSGDTSWTITNASFAIQDVSPDISVVANVNSFHGARVEKSGSTARTAATFIPVYDTEVYDTDGFGDLGSDNDRVTIPAGVTKVRVTAMIAMSSGSANTDNFFFIEHYNSADALQRQYGQDPRNTSGIRPKVSITPIVVVVAGDYFKLSIHHNDASWTETYVSLDVEYKDGTLVEAVAAGGGSGGRAEKQADFALSGDTTVTWDTEIYDDDNFIDIAGAATELAVGTASRVNVFASVKTTNTVSASTVIISINHFNSSDSLIAKVAKHQSNAVSGITEEAIAALGIPVSSGDYFTFTIFFSDTSVTVDLATATIQDVSP